MSDELYKEVKETERKVAENPPKDEKIKLKGELADDVIETEKEVGKKTYIQLEKDDVESTDRESVTPEEVNQTTTSVVDTNLNKRSENLSSGATHNDTGIFPQP